VRQEGQRRYSRLTDNMGGFSTLPVGGAPNKIRNPILDEIDRAASNAHATLSPQAQEVVRRTTAAPVPGPGNTMDRSPVEQMPPQMPAQPIAGPSGTPKPIGGPPPREANDGLRDASTIPQRPFDEMHSTIQAASERAMGMRFPAPYPSTPRPAPAMPFPTTAPGSPRTAFNTPLAEGEQAQFGAWKDQNAPNDSGQDYDLQGAYKYGLSPAENGHWSDRFKKPNHPTFSNESQYAGYGNPGSWRGETFTPPAQPIATPAQARLAAEQAPPIHHHNKFLRGLGYAGDALLTTFAPRAAQVIPGTMLNKQLKLANAENAVTDEQNVLNDQSKRGLEQSQADENAARVPLIGAQTEEANARVPFIHAQTVTEEGKPELQQQAADVRQQTADLAAQRQRETVQSALLKAGYEMGPDGTPVAIPRERLPESERAKLDQLDNLGALRNAQAELAAANAELARAKAAGVPAQIEATKIKAANAERAHDIALANLGLHRQQFEFQSQGTVNDVAPPGTLLTEDGRPVGTRNATNVRPTTQQRGRGDLGTSAQHQLEDMRAIVQQRPDIFGPAAGRKTDFSVWLGSEDPDAAKFRTARTILGDHEAGTFGGRSDQTVKDLQVAAGLFKTNPEAILASLGQLEKATKTFIKAGTVRTVGSDANKPQGMIRARDPQGNLHEAPAGTPLPAGWKEEKAR